MDLPASQFEREGPAPSIIEPLCAVFRRKIRSEGLKYTPERARVLDAIIELDRLFEADELLETLRGGDHRVSKATVYRTIRLLQDAGIVRHQGKIRSTINNAKRAIDLREEFGSLSDYFWGYKPDPKTRPTRMTHKALMALTESDASRALSKDLKKRGWSFVGPTTAYAFMQAITPRFSSKVPTK